MLYGQAGNDRLDGGAGLDLLKGGTGADTFVFSTGRDVVLDFSLAEGDRLDISRTGFASEAAFLEAFGKAATRGSADTLAWLGLDVAGNGHHVELRARDADGDILAISLEGVSTGALLAQLRLGDLIERSACPCGRTRLPDRTDMSVSARYDRAGRKGARA